MTLSEIRIRNTDKLNTIKVTREILELELEVVGDKSCLKQNSATRHLCFLERQFLIGLQYLILILQNMPFFEAFEAFWVVSVLFAVKL